MRISLRISKLANYGESEVKATGRVRNMRISVWISKLANYDNGFQKLRVTITDFKICEL